MKALKKAAIASVFFALMLTFTFSTSYGQVMDTTQTKAQAAYTLKGKVVDAQTMNAVSKAEVSVAGTNITATTDQDGKFELNSLPAGMHTLTIKADHFQKWEKKFTLNESLDKLTIKLKPKE